MMKDNGGSGTFISLLFSHKHTFIIVVQASFQCGCSVFYLDLQIKEITLNEVKEIEQRYAVCVLDHNL